MSEAIGMIFGVMFGFCAALPVALLIAAAKRTERNIEQKKQRATITMRRCPNCNEWTMMK